MKKDVPRLSSLSVLVVQWHRYIYNQQWSCTNRLTRIIPLMINYCESLPVHWLVKILFPLKWRQTPVQSLRKTCYKVNNYTFALEDGSLTLYPAVAWEIVRGVFCFVFDRHPVDEPITVQHAAIILQGNHRKLANIFGGHVVLVRLSCFEVVVKPFVQRQGVCFTIGTLIKR